MAITSKQRSELVTDLLNGTLKSINTVIPVRHSIGKPQMADQSLQLEFGVLIGITGDIKGKLVLSGQTSVFGDIGELMFGSVIENDMLHSFSGELGNMIAGSLSTNIVEKGIKTDITHPTILQGNTTISGHNQAIQLLVEFTDIGKIFIYLLLD